MRAETGDVRLEAVTAAGVVLPPVATVAEGSQITLKCTYPPTSKFEVSSSTLLVMIEDRWIAQVNICILYSLHYEMNHNVY